MRQRHLEERKVQKGSRPDGGKDKRRKKGRKEGEEGGGDRK